MHILKIERHCRYIGLRPAVHLIGASLGLSRYTVNDGKILRCIMLCYCPCNQLKNLLC